MSWIDMHLHSCYSDDGEYTPKELIAMCQKSGVKVAAIADHNTVKGIKEAKKYAKQMGITLIPGIELDCTFQGVNLHLLGYKIDESVKAFAKVEEELLRKEQQAARKRIEYVRALGIHIAADDDIISQARNGVVTGEMLAEVALADLKNDNNLLLVPYRQGGARSDNPFVNFYWDYCAQGKPAYIPIYYISLKEAVQLICDAGGIPVLAHPGNNINEDEVLLRGILQEGAQGIEVFSSYHSTKKTNFYLEKALEWGTQISCGSDFHGKTKPKIQIGSVDCRGYEEIILSQFKE